MLVLASSTEAAPTAGKLQSDLVVSSVTTPPRAREPGESFSVADRVRNAGRLGTKRFAVGYFLSADRTFGKGDVFAATRNVRALGAGKSMPAAMRVFIPRRIASRLYFVLVCADRLRSVGEQNERNNCRASARPLFVGFRPAAPSLDRQPTALTNATSMRIGFASGGGGPGVGFRCSLDGARFSACSSPVEYAALAEGAHTFEVKALDRFGREGRPSKFSWRVDLTAPEMPSFLTRPGDPTNVASPSFTIGGIEPGARLECTVNWGPVQLCDAAPTYAPLPEGRHVFAVRARDGASNESAFRTYAWTIDLTAPPMPSFTSVPGNVESVQHATFAFSSTESGVSYRCRLDGYAYEPCSSPQTYGALAEGVHSLAVVARDAAGNESAARSHGWRVDVYPPTLTLTSRPSNQSRFQHAVFEFTASEAVQNVRCRLDSGGFAPCASPFSYAGPLNEGPHTFTVSAEDLVGKSGSATFTWWVDLTPPSRPTLTSFPENPTDQTAASFSFSSSEPGLTYRCMLDFGSFVACPDTQIFWVGHGSHRLYVVAVDAAGNESSTAAYRWMVDRTPPPALGFDLGVFRFGGPPAVREFSQWLNRPVTRVLDYIPGNSWEALSKPEWVLTQWQLSGYKPVYSTPMLAGSSTTLAEGAKGTYDAHYKLLAQTLVAYGQGDAVIRLGWEFNGNWFPWAAKGKTADFITYWRRIVNVMRAVSPRLRFDWNPAYGPLDFPADQAYPGDAYVDYIGLVVFDQGWEPGYDNAVLRWRNFISLPFALQWHQDFAAAHGKRMTYPEWALTWRDDYPGHGGGDNPYYIEKMYQWFNSNPVEYALYFEDDKVGSTRHELMAGNFPNAAARFRQLWGR